MIDAFTGLDLVELLIPGRWVYRGWRKVRKSWIEDLLDGYEPPYWADYECTPMWPLDRLDPPKPITMVWIEDRLQA